MNFFSNGMHYTLIVSTESYVIYRLNYSKHTVILNWFQIIIFLYFVVIMAVTAYDER